MHEKDLISGDILDKVSPALEKQGLELDCVGGGRILHDPDKKSLKVFGYSTVRGGQANR